MAPESGFSALELMQARVNKIPAGWDFVHLDKAYKIRNALRKPINESDRARNPGPYPYYGPTRAQGHIGTYEQDGDFALIGEDGDHFLKYKSMPMTQLVSGKCTVNNHAHVIEGSRRAIREWFYYYFMHRDIFAFLTRQGAGRYKLNKAALQNLPILVPPIEEQKLITDILATWDRAIETSRRLVDTSKAQRKALMQQLLTGKKRFSSFEVSNKTKETKYGDLPDDWPFVPMGEIAAEQSERAGHNSDLPVLSCSKYDGFVDSLVYFKKKVFSEDTSNYKVARRGYYGFPSNHIEEGSIGHQNICDAGIVSPIYTVFKTNDQVHDGYLYRLLKTEHYRQIFAARTNASVDRRGSLRWTEFGKIYVPLPSLPEQEKISDAVNAADAEIAGLEQQLLRLNTEKRALMQQLLTGKRRVKVAA